MRRFPALILATILVAAACGGDGAIDDAAGSTTGPPTTAAPDDPVTTRTPPNDGTTGTPAPAGTPVPEALSFTAELVGGGEFTGADLAGHHTVFWFWAPWCPTCAAASADVLAAAEAHPAVTFVGVAGLSSDAASMERFVADHGVGGFEHISDTSGHVYTRFGVVQQHTFAFVSVDGTVETVSAYGRDVDLDTLVDDIFG